MTRSTYNASIPHKIALGGRKSRLRHSSWAAIAGKIAIFPPAVGPGPGGAGRPSGSPALGSSCPARWESHPRPVAGAPGHAVGPAGELGRAQHPQPDPCLADSFGAAAPRSLTAWAAGADAAVPATPVRPRAHRSAAHAAVGAHRQAHRAASSGGSTQT